MKINTDNLVQPQQTPRVSSVVGQPGPRPELHSPFTSGREVTGEVFARLSDEVYLLKIAGEIYRSDIPLQLRPGEQLKLVLNAAQPRPSFIMRDSAQDGEPVRISPATSRISSLAMEAPDRPSSPARITGPIIESPPTDPSLLADALRSSLSRSGLFYESHLARWLQGEKLLAEILKEPQARLSAILRRPRRPASSDPSLEEIGISSKEDQAADSLCAEDKQPGLLDDAFGLVDHETIPVVREQLSMILSGMARLRCEVWPDQEMEWDLEREDDETGRDPGSSWRTSIRLRLPNLGLVRAVITMSNEGMRGEIKTESAAAIAFMEREVETLERSLTACGLRVLELVVGHEQES